MWMLIPPRPGFRDPLVNLVGAPVMNFYHFVSYDVDRFLRHSCGA